MSNVNLTGRKVYIKAGRGQTPHNAYVAGERVLSKSVDSGKRVDIGGEVLPGGDQIPAGSKMIVRAYTGEPVEFVIEGRFPDVHNTGRELYTCRPVNDEDWKGVAPLITVRDIILKRD